jgi:mannose/cellobiose epimerase-like protein (N-acyl-D-glucosamine 2-epimerase family)
VLKQKPVDLPKRWEDLTDLLGYWVSKDSRISTANTSPIEENRNVWPTKEEAEASIALAQLCQLRDVYNGAWKPDWTDDSLNHVIELVKDRPYRETYTTTRRVLSFKSEKLRDEFLENFRDLIEIAKPLL